MAAALFAKGKLMTQARKALVLSIGYGEGHHAAAAALRDELLSRGWMCSVADVCQEANPRLFWLTQVFYQFCVRRMPWLWGVTYAQTETPDWAEMLKLPGVYQAKCLLADLIRRDMPDIIYCTYPLFAYMLDSFYAEGWLKIPYVVVVTDALEISRPWMKTRARLVCVTDAETRQIVLERYGLSASVVIDAGFPVKKEFNQRRVCSAPSWTNCRIVYGAYAPTRRVCRDIRAILEMVPGAEITLIAGARESKLVRLLDDEIKSGKLVITRRIEKMADLFCKSHLYIGKAGAATMFEAYSVCLPMLINYALPGQEQGNLQLLLNDDAGLYVDSTADLRLALRSLLSHNAQGWHHLHVAMKTAARWDAAARIVEAAERRFF